MDTRKSPSAITLKYDFQWLAPSLIGIGRAIPVGLGKCFILSYTMKKNGADFTPLETISRRQKNKMSLTGFTLVEIMIVLAIVIALLTIAMPNFLRSRVIANETAALANCRSINNACQLYHINQETYPNSLTDLVEPASNPSYIDSTLATGRKQGYEFIYQLVDSGHFTLNANPLSSGLLKGRYFYMDESGIIRAKSDGPAGPTDEIVL